MKQKTIPSCVRCSCEFLIIYEDHDGELCRNVLMAHDKYDAGERMRKAHAPAGPIKLIDVREIN